MVECVHGKMSCVFKQKIIVNIIQILWKLKCAHKPFSLNCIWILKFVWQFKRVLVPGNYHFFGKYFQNVVSLQNLRLLLSVLTYREGLSSNTVTLIEYFKNITRNWIASRNASWTLLTRILSPRENDAWLSCRRNCIVISFLKTRGKWHTKSSDSWVVFSKIWFPRDLLV